VKTSDLVFSVISFSLHFLDQHIYEAWGSQLQQMWTLSIVGCNQVFQTVPDLGWISFLKTVILIVGHLLAATPCQFLYYLLKPSDHFTYHQVFNVQNYSWFSHCVYVFCMDLTADSDFCLIQPLRSRAFTAWYGLSLYIKMTHLVFRGLMHPTRTWPSSCGRWPEVVIYHKDPAWLWLLVLLTFVPTQRAHYLVTMSM
jgi:hypothetical protein